jgi:hypothetical protein
MNRLSLLEVPYRVVVMNFFLLENEEQASQSQMGYMNPLRTIEYGPG